MSRENLAAMFDGTKSEAIRRGANLFLKERYGELLSLRVDSRSRTLSMEVMLRGETEAVAVEIGAYELDESDGVSKLIFRQIRVSRPWMEELARSYGEGIPFRVPRDLTGLVKMVLL